MPKLEHPFYPIIYVRGYAGNDEEIDDTVADPYMGFNLGATKFRQLWDGRTLRHYFESPLVRLMKDHGYRDVYSGGQEMPLDVPISPKSVFIYRYYDAQYSEDLSSPSTNLQNISGLQQEVEDYAKGLSKLILRVRDHICQDDQEALDSFRVYLVAHSMGGLVCRCFLQNSEIGCEEARSLVDKVFTYATPHNGIDFRVIGNVPGFFSMNNIDNFNRTRMAEYLALDETSNVANLDGKFDCDRFFCLVGTNWKDYQVAGGWSKRVTGPMSDGLVRIVNATVHDSSGPRTKHCPRALVHRSHSGHYGIVNSEEGYQNMVRFLFGDVRVDGILEIESLTLPPAVEKAHEAGETIKASYHFEVAVGVRGYDWQLHRRTADEGSAIFRTFDEMFPKEGRPRYPYLFSTYLSSGARVNSRRRSLGFSIDLRVLVPEYMIDGILWMNEYYKGSYLFRDTITLEATPSEGEEGRVTYGLRYGFDSRTPNRATKSAELVPGEDYAWRIPIVSRTRPGISAKLLLRAKGWN